MRFLKEAAKEETNGLGPKRGSACATVEPVGTPFPSERATLSTSRLSIQGARKIVAALFRPFDTSTGEGRSKERYRRAALTTIASATARGIAILTSLISVPLSLRYLGSERFGLWMTIVSLALLLQFADFGMGNGLLNAVSEANGKQDPDGARKYVASGFFMLLGIAIFLSVIFAMAYRLVPWPRVFNVSSGLATREAGPATAVFAACILLNLPLDVVQRVQMGYQEGFATNLWQVGGSLMGLAGLLLVIHFQGGLPWLVAATSGGPLVAVSLNWITQFGWSKPWLFPKWAHFDTLAARKVLGTGILFVVLQLAAAVAYASDNIVLAQVRGSEAVTQYAVPMRMFSVLGTIAAFSFAPLWPAYGEAIARGDIGWVVRTLVRSLQLTLLICGIPAVCLVMLGRNIVHIWVGPLIQPSFFLLLGMGIWAVLGGLGSALAMFLNGANILKFQVVCAVLMASAALVLKILLAGRWGGPGVIWGTVIAFTFCTAIPFTIYLPRLLSALGRSGAGATRVQLERTVVAGDH
jgi:O-antigen/teichoic acid export membrane protein